MIPKISVETLDELVKQVNRRLELIDREFAQKHEVKNVLSEVKSLSEIATRDIEEKELKVRDNNGTVQLVIRMDGRLHTVDLTKQTP
jgi:hypothetical protein